jgi:hypothetical protein
MKVGDLVICTSNEYFKTALTLGKQYKVLPVPESESFVLGPDTSLIHVLCDTGTITSFINNRFVLDKQGTRDEKINSIIEE